MHFVGSPKVSFVQEFALCKQLEQSLPLTPKWSTDQSWTWKQGLTNASLLVGGTLSKNSWQWANLLWTYSAKTAMYFQINSSILQRCFQGKNMLKNAWKLFFFAENRHKRVLNLQTIKWKVLAWSIVDVDSYSLLSVKESLCTIFSGTPCIEFQIW